jgi:hypothetical protein
MVNKSTITLGTVERLAKSTTAENQGVNLQELKQIANRLQDTVVKQQLQEHRSIVNKDENVSPVAGCGRSGWPCQTARSGAVTEKGTGL